MTWTIDVAMSARRDLRNIDPAVATRIVERLQTIRTDPLRFMKRLKGGHDWSLRVGDWRVILQVDARVRKAQVLHVLHRSVAYR